MFTASRTNRIHSDLATIDELREFSEIFPPFEFLTFHCKKLLNLCDAIEGIYKKQKIQKGLSFL